MNRNEVKAVVLEALTDIAPEVTPGDIVPDEPLRDQVDLDSIDFLNLLVRLHEKLGVDVPEAVRVRALVPIQRMLEMSA